VKLPDERVITKLDLKTPAVS